MDFGHHPDDRPQVTADWIGAVGSGSPVNRTQGRVWSAKHQTWRAFQIRGAPVRDKTGKIIEWAGALIDVQDALDAQVKLLQRDGALRRSDSDRMARSARLTRAVSDAVISDYRLPTLSGLEVIESVRQRWPAATAIILSGDTFDPHLHALSNTGVKVLRKPVRRETLAQAVESRFLRGGARAVPP